MRRRQILKSAAFVGLTGMMGACARAEGNKTMERQANKINVLCWSEHTEPRHVYPHGINTAIADFLRRDPGLAVRTSSITDADQGISRQLLSDADVLIWWGHLKHQVVNDGSVDEIVRQVRDRGLALIVLHSSHHSKPFTRVLNVTGDIASWREDGKPEHLKCVAPAHPIARGMQDFTLPVTEMYNEPFQVPPPEKVVFFSYWDAGEQFRSCCTWTAGKGRVVYFRPGHEDYPIYFQDEPLRVVRNSVYWGAGKES